jgi:putative hydrolase of the HAD superfamily
MSQTIKIVPIDLVLFDFGGVIAEEGFRNGLQSIAQHNGLDKEAFVKEAYDLTFNGGFVIGEVDEHTFWVKLRDRTGIKGSDQELRNEILSRFVLRPWMLELVQQLHNSSVSTAILSDQTKWLDELDAQHNFFKLFDRVFNSYHLGKCKKDPSWFEDVLDEMGFRPEQSLFIDDSLDNIKRAQNRGLHTIHYQDKDSFMESMLAFCPFLLCPSPSPQRGGKQFTTK